MSKDALSILVGWLVMLGSIVIWIAVLPALVQLIGPPAQNPFIETALMLTACFSSVYISYRVQTALRRRLGID